MVKTIIGIILIVSTIIFIYPIEMLMTTTGLSIFVNDYSSDSELIKGFGDVKIENYEKYEKIGAEAYGECYAIYFNEEQANIIEKQINIDKNWTRKPFNDKLINNYERFNINCFENSYYYLIEFDKDYNTIETNREVLDNKELEWYKSAIYDSDNKIIYYYYRHYEK